MKLTAEMKEFEADILKKSKDGKISTKSAISASVDVTEKLCADILVPIFRAAGYRGSELNASIFATLVTVQSCIRTGLMDFDDGEPDARPDDEEKTKESIVDGLLKLAGEDPEQLVKILKAMNDMDM